MNSQLELPAFGKIESNRILALDDLFAIVLDKFLISHGHSLIIARRRVARFLRQTEGSVLEYTFSSPGSLYI
jgi:hypothetical protein